MLVARRIHQGKPTDLSFTPANCSNQCVRALDVGPVLLGGEEGLFLSGNPSVCVARQTVGTLTFLSNAPASSPNVMSGVLRISSASCSKSSSSSLLRYPAVSEDRGPSEPVWRRRWINRRTHDSQQSNCFRHYDFRGAARVVSLWPPRVGTPIDHVDIIVNLLVDAAKRNSSHKRGQDSREKML